MTTDASLTPNTGSRAELRDAARRAGQAWIGAIVADFTVLADTVGVAGPDRVVCMYVEINHDSCEHHHWREDLKAVHVTGPNDAVVLRPGSGPAWAEATALWMELREAVEHRHRTDLGPGLLLDLDTQTLGTWEPYYCPDEGDPDLEAVILLADDEPDSEDPFEALLADDDEDDLYVAEERIQVLMDTYRLSAPTAPAHAPGDCDGE